MSSCVNLRRPRRRIQSGIELTSCCAKILLLFSFHLYFHLLLLFETLRGLISLPPPHLCFYLSLFSLKLLTVASLRTFVFAMMLLPQQWILNLVSSPTVDRACLLPGAATTILYSRRCDLWRRIFLAVAGRLPTMSLQFGTDVLRARFFLSRTRPMRRHCDTSRGMLSGLLW